MSEGWRGAACCLAPLCGYVTAWGCTRYTSGAWDSLEGQTRLIDGVATEPQAIAGDNKDKTLFGNRSAAYLALGRFDEAVLDAAKAIDLDQDWAKVRSTAVICVEG